MAPVTKHAILKKLETLYWSAFHGGKWHIALQVVELQGKNIGMFEKPCLSEVMRITGMTEQQWRDVTDARQRLDPEVTHPPPPAEASESAC